MKSIIVLRMAIFSFFLLGLAFLSPADQLKAQTPSTTNPIFSIPQETFVAPAVAIVRLDDAIVPIKEAMNVLPQGSPDYKLAYARYVCYNTTQNAIIGGKTVAESIVDGLKTVSTDEYDLPKQALPNFRTDLINLLKS